MAEENKEVRYDVDGYETLTEALMQLCKEFATLTDVGDIYFASLPGDRGRALIPITGAIIETEHKYISGLTSQKCLYPFFVQYKASGLSEARRAAAKEWLDNLGRWLEKQTVLIDNVQHRLEKYPALTEGRKLTAIERQTPAYLEEVQENGVELWTIYITAKYRNEFYRR